MTAGSKATRREVSTFWQRVERFERDNIEAARIIAADPRRYPGAMQTWVARVLARIEHEQRRAA